MSNQNQDVADLPDDFFNDLADDRFIDEVIEKGGNESDDDLKHYVEEINRLQNDIKIRKQKIKEGEAILKREHQRSRSRSSSRSKTRRNRGEKDGKRRRTRSRSPHTSRLSRYDERLREQRYPLSPVRGGGGIRPNRRTRSKSPLRHPKRSSSTHKNLTFLEELAQKFAEKGQAFPEKDALLMGAHNSMMNNAAMDQSIPMEFGNVLSFDQPNVQQPLIGMPNFPQQQIGFPAQQSNIFYGLNPMSIMAGNRIPPQSVPNNIPSYSAIGQPDIAPNLANPRPLPMLTDTISSNNQKALIDRCEQAIKLIRAKDNKVPVMKMLYNRTSMVVSNSNDLVGNKMNKSPLQAHSILNPLFKLNAPQPANNLLKNDGLKMLPTRVKDVAQSLGINAEFLFNKMKTKELNAQITNQIMRSEIMDTEPAKGEILFQTSTVPLPNIITTEMGTQTSDTKCEECTKRNKRTMINVHSQTFFRGVSIGVQTNEKDYREPIVELLSRMTAAQLVAIKDFTNIVDEPRPRNTDEMYKIRERLMDIYSLSQRDADAVRAADESHMDEPPFMEPRIRGREMYGEGSSRDFDCRSRSPIRFNGKNMNERSGSFGRNIEPNEFINDRSTMIDDRPRFMMDDRNFRGRDGPYPIRPISQDDDEELERRRYLELERKRELELEMTQRRYDEQREQERLLAMQSNFSQRQLPNPPEDEMLFREQEERGRPNIFNNAGRGGTINRRGRGAFRDNFRGGRGSRR